MERQAYAAIRPGVNARGARRAKAAPGMSVAPVEVPIGARRQSAPDRATHRSEPEDSTMANRDDKGADRSNERMGRGVKEGLNAGQSRNAHDSGARSASGRDQDRGAERAGSSRDMQADSSERGRGGYGDDTGTTGGSRSARDRGDLEHNSPRAAAPGSEGASTEDHSRIDGVGHQAPSGMEERESSGETR
jgi:hypothetical protein